MISYSHRITVERNGETIKCRSLTGVEVERISTIADGDDEKAAGFNASAYVVACCLLDDDGKPVFQGEADIGKAKELPFWVIEAVTDACLADAGISLKDEAAEVGN